MRTWQRLLVAAWHGLSPEARRQVVGVSLLAGALVALAALGPGEWQLAAVLALVALLILVQGYILWKLWQQGSVFREARDAYLRGDFEGAARLLEAGRGDRTLDPAAETLLGNAYRQLGRLEESERVLRSAYQAEPRAPLPAYGLGRTLLVRGQYAEAASLIADALANRGRPVILADLGLAQYRAGMWSEAKASLQEAVGLELEPHRALMAHYLLWRLQERPADGALRAVLEPFRDGLDVWRAEAERFAGTSYGVALSEDIARIKEVLEGQFP